MWVVLAISYLYFVPNISGGKTLTTLNAVCFGENGKPIYNHSQYN
jgi:hypothetical protein